MNDYNKQIEVLHSPFDINTHKDTFTNYLEVVILKDGTIQYAVPSHQEKLMKLACQALNLPRDVIEIMCPKEYYCDYMLWLSKLSGACAVWNNYTESYEYTEEQIQQLKLLKEEGLYHGFIPMNNLNKDNNNFEIEYY